MLLSKHLLWVSLCQLLFHVDTASSNTFASSVETLMEHVNLKNPSEIYHTLSAWKAIAGEQNQLANAQAICYRLKDMAKQVDIAGKHYLAGASNIIGCQVEVETPKQRPTTHSIADLHDFVEASEWMNSSKADYADLLTELGKLSSTRTSLSDLAMSMEACIVISQQVNVDNELLKNLVNIGIGKINDMNMITRKAPAGKLTKFLNALLQMSRTTGVEIRKEKLMEIAKFLNEPKRYDCPEQLHYSIEAAKLLTDGKSLPVYVSISVHGDSLKREVVVDSHRSLVRLSVRDSLGRAIPEATQLTVDKTTRTDGKTLESALSGAKLIQDNSDKYLFSFDTKYYNLEAGSYLIQLSLVNTNIPLVATTNTVRLIVQKPAEIADLEVEIVKKPDTIQHSLGASGSLPEGLQLTGNDGLKVIGSLRSPRGHVSPDQASLVFRHEESGKKMVVTGQISNSNEFSFKLLSISKQIKFAGLSGKHTVAIMIAGKTMENVISQKLGSVSISWPTMADQTGTMSSVKPVINHVFAAPVKRPPFVISLAFTVAILVTLISLLIMFGMVGMNLSGLRGYLSVPIYHLLHIGLIAGICYCWAFLSMVRTIMFVFAMHGLMFFFGRRIFIAIVNNKQNNRK